MQKTVDELKFEYGEYLKQLNIDSLRSLGRHVGVYNPTENKKKGELIELIISVLVGETKPVDRTRRGAPVKAVLNPEVLRRLEEIGGTIVENAVSNKYGDLEMKSATDAIDEALKKYFGTEKKNRLTVKSSEEFFDLGTPTVYVGQIEKVAGFYCIFPLNARDFEERIVVTESAMARYSLKEGDVVSCTAKECENVLYVQEILRINECEVGCNRLDFEKDAIRLSTELLSLSNDMLLNNFLPFVKGRRCLIVGEPKTGKTMLLKAFAKKLSAEKNVKTFGVLIDQSLETAIDFSRTLDERSLVYTTYEDDAESHLFVAEFILKRAKRYAELGKDVVLIIDGTLSLAKAYDELNYSNDKVLSCGLTAKTVRYIKKYLGAARAFENGGSLTIICSLSSSTGNPEDDLFVSEIAPVFNAKISLCEDLAVKRIFPAVDFSASYVDGYESLVEEKYREAYLFVRNYFLPKFGNEQLYRIAQNSADFDEFFNTIKSFVANS